MVGYTLLANKTNSVRCTDDQESFKKTLTCRSSSKALTVPSAFSLGSHSAPFLNFRLDSALTESLSRARSYLLGLFLGQPYYDVLPCLLATRETGNIFLSF